MKLELYVTDKCIPCAHVLEFIQKNGLEDKIKVVKNGKHPMVYSTPALIFNEASVIKGVESIEKFLSVHYIPKEVK